MLVVRRKVGEIMVIGGNVRVMVLAVEGGRIKIGVEAPDEVSVLREELLYRGNPDLAQKQEIHTGF